MQKIPLNRRETSVTAHFWSGWIEAGWGGKPDSWASREVNALILLATEIPLFLLLMFMPPLTLRFPPKLINLPHKEYWLRQENRAVLKAKLGRLMAQFGTALFLFLMCTIGLTLHANLSDPVQLHEGAFLLALILFLGYTAVWCIGLFRAFRIPKSEGH